MSSAIDLPLRESSMPRSSSYSADVAVSWPDFGYWVKAGIAFSIGAGIVYVVSEVLWLLFLANTAIALFRALGRH